MLDLKVDRLQESIAAETERIAMSQKELERLDQKMRRLLIRKSNEEKLIRSSQNIIARLQAGIIIANGVSEMILALRNTIVGMAKELGREDILVRKQTELRKQIATACIQIQKICPHPFVVGYRGYEGSQIMDYEDGCYGYRLCIVCGAQDNSKSTHGPVYSVLTESAERIVRETSFSNDERRAFHNFEVWKPLEPMVQKIFLEGKAHEYFQMYFKSVQIISSCLVSKSPR